MKSKINHTLILIIIVAIFLSTFSTSAFSYEKTMAGDIDSLTFKQEITVPIDTSLEQARYQPIDIRIEFDNTCWAKNEQEHSVRVGYDDGSGLMELESQIYDLKHSDDSHIKSCSLVFLVPEGTDGKEKYYICYDSSETSPPEYEDHLELEDTHYFYEPISGQKIDFDYYGIKEDGYVVYVVVQKGELLGNPIALSVINFKPKTTVVETYDLDQLGAFDMRYGTVEQPGYIGSSWATKVAKNVLVDGNLMIRVRIEGTSPRDDIKSDNIYTYYYSPGETKSISVDVNHEVLKKIDMDEPSTLDGTYAGITSIKSMSATIEKMNVGDILPSIILYGEDDVIKEFSIPPNPDSSERELVLSTQDDCDLGKKAWVCLNDPSNGKAHGLILNSNVGFSSGEDDGVQVKVYVKQSIKLPGLEADTGNVFLTRNTYEKGSEHKTILDEGLSINFDVKFITMQNQGCEQIDSDSGIYQTLIKSVPIFRENVSKGEVEEVKRYQLTTFVHLSPSFPMGSLLSAAVGKNFPYIYAELYRDNSFKSSGSVGRLSLASMDLDFEGKKLFEKIKTAVGIFDWKNASFSKKIVFPDLEPGRYVVKIHRENLFFNRESKYIGFAIVNLKEDAQTRIYCRPEGSMDLSVVDQQDKGIENVKFLLLKDDVVVSDMVSDENGTATLKAPCLPRQPYTFKVIYQGFLVDEKQVTLGLKNSIKSLSESYSILLHTLELTVKDEWGLSPEIEVNPKLASNEMVEPVSISAEKQKNAKYIFTGLYPNRYVLSMGYKAFEVEKDIQVDKDGSLQMTFPAEYKTELHMLNSYGNDLNDGEVVLLRGGKKVRNDIDKNGDVSFLVPPGEYELIVTVDNEEISKQKIVIKSDKVLDVLTNQGSILHSVVIILGVLLAIVSIIIFTFWKKDVYRGVKLLVIALLMIAIVSPWWVLSGDDGTTSTTTQTLLVPSKIVTLTSSSGIIGGEVSSVPEQVTMVLGLLSILICVSCLLIGMTILSKNKYRKTTMAFSILSLIVLSLTVFLFFYTMSMVAEIGVGGFAGSVDIETTLPGIAGSKILPCSWGPGMGFCLGVISIIGLITISIYNKFKKQN